MSQRAIFLVWRASICLKSDTRKGAGRLVFDDLSDQTVDVEPTCLPVTDPPQGRRLPVRGQASGDHCTLRPIGYFDGRAMSAVSKPQAIC